jgi:ABC-type uncharacterized transport system ATPase component
MQTQAAPAAPTAPAAPAVAVYPATPAPGSITIVGKDGVAKTIIIPNGSNPFIERVAERAAASAAERAAQGPRGAQFAQGMAGGVALSLVVFTIVSFWRRYKRRGMPVAAAAQVATGSPERLERMERGIEAIAIEVERISEGQRFVTNLLAESRQPVIAEPK